MDFCPALFFHVCRYEDCQRMHVQNACQLVNLLQGRAFAAPLERTEIRPATRAGKIFLSQSLAVSNLFERQAERGVEFQFAESAKRTMKRYRNL